MRWETYMEENPLHLRTDGGGVVTLFRVEEIADWLDANTPKPQKGGAKWRGFNIVAYRRDNSALWEPCT